MAIAFVSSLLVQELVFPLFSVDHDEPVYALQADALRDGSLTLPAGGEIGEQFFRPWLTGVRDGRFYTVYLPGWPAMLAFGDLLGSQRIAVALTASLAVLAVYAFTREVTRRPGVGAVAAVFLTLSPVLVVQGGLRLSYLFALACGLLFATALLHGVRADHPLSLLGAGCALGAVLLARPFDAALWAVPLTLAIAFRTRRDWRRLVRVSAWTAVGLAPFVVALLVYNAHVTGAPFELPAAAAEPLNRFGFGSRGVASTSPPIDYSVAKALEALGDNLRAVPPFVFGGVAGLVLAVVGLIAAHRRSEMIAIVGLLVIFPVAYFFYWGTLLQGVGASSLGPQYYVPSLAMLVVLSAVGVVEVWRRWRIVAIGTVTIMAVLSGWALADKIPQHLRVTDDYEATNRVVQDASLRDAILFVPYFEDPFLLEFLPFLGNRPDLRGPVLYAVDSGPDNITLIEARRDRRPYRLTSRIEPGDDLLVPTERVEALHVESAPRYAVDVEIDTPRGVGAVVTYADGGSAVPGSLLEASVTPGVAHTRWIFAPPASPTGKRTVVLPAGTGTFSVGVTLSDDAEVDDSDESYELRFDYRARRGRLEVLEPPGQWHRVVLLAEPAWFPETITDVLRLED